MKIQTNNKNSNNNIADVIGVPLASSQDFPSHKFPKKSSISACNFSPEGFFSTPARQARSTKEFSP